MPECFPSPSVSDLFPLSLVCLCSINAYLKSTWSQSLTPAFWPHLILRPFVVILIYSALLWDLKFALFYWSVKRALSLEAIQKSEKLICCGNLMNVLDDYYLTTVSVLDLALNKLNLFCFLSWKYCSKLKSGYSKIGKSTHSKNKSFVYLLFIFTHYTV